MSTAPPPCAAVRAFADLPMLPDDVTLPERETFRARLLTHDAETMRDRQRAAVQTQLAGWLARIEHAETFDGARRLNGWLFGAVMLAHALDLLSLAEADQWQRQAMDALRGVR